MMNLNVCVKNSQCVPKLRLTDTAANADKKSSIGTFEP